MSAWLGNPAEPGNRTEKEKKSKIPRELIDQISYSLGIPLGQDITVSYSLYVFVIIKIWDRIILESIATGVPKWNDGRRY